MKTITHLSFAVLAVAPLTLCACSGDSGSDSNRGWITTAITDSPSDEISSFVVDVTAVELTKANGDVIDILTSPVQVDLATLTDASQILNTAKVPRGDYSMAQITLDFTNASAVLVDQTVPATLNTTGGIPLTGQVVLPMQIDTNFHLAGDRHRVLEFDFGLDQSLVVDSVANTVTVEPCIGLRVDPAQPKPLVAVGRLLEVTRANDTFTVQLETPAGVRLETLLFESRNGTVYQVNGNPYLGPSGADALDQLPVDTWVQVYGDREGDTSHYHAIAVEAGDGTYNGGQDSVSGWVIDRSSGAGSSAILTVLGDSTNATHTNSQFNTTFTVATDFANTKVNRFANETSHNLDDVNVGQRVRVFGALVGTNIDASSTSGVIRFYPSDVFGLAAGGPNNGVLTIALQRVDTRDPSAFTWANSGTTPPNTGAFTIDIGTLGSSLNIVAGTPIRARGFFAPVNDASSDFNAKEVGDLSQGKALLIIDDLVNGMTVTTTTASGSISFDITGAPIAGELLIVDQGFIGVTPLATTPAPTIQPEDSNTLCVLRDLDLGTVNVYTHFSSFSDALGLKLVGGGRLAHFGALGNYNGVTNTLSANEISVVID